MITAIRIIEERERINKKADREVKKFFFTSTGSLRVPLEQGLNDLKKLVRVTSIFPKKDVILLKKITGEATKEAIATAVYYYLENAPWPKKLISEKKY